MNEIEPCQASPGFTSMPMNLQPFDPAQFLIMVVDDTAANLELMGRILRGAGYRTTFAISGQQAVERLDTLMPDLILLDWMMPAMNGIQVCQTLQGNPKHRQIPVVFLTARQDRESCVQAFETGAVDYITKPFHRLELLARVRTHLRLKDMSDRLQASLHAVEHLARTDALTGILNRRSLFEFAEQQFQRSQRYGHPFAVIIFDIDHFKAVNDEYGHLMGDRVLKAVTAMVQTQIRTLDCFGRYGGEEFVLVLPDSDHEAGGILSDRLRKNFANLHIDPIERRITASFGVAAYEPQDDHIDTLFNRADQALYHAKQAGRNCSFVCSGGTLSPQFNNCREITAEITEPAEPNG